MNILLVEDDRKIRLYIAKFLRRLGHQVAEHANGKEALDAYHAEEFALVLSDVNMPGMSGIELLRSIKKRSEVSQAAVALFTGYNDIDSAIEALRLGAVDYLLKPISTEDLVAVVKKVADATNLQPDNKMDDISPIEKVLAQAMNIRKVGLFSEAMRKIIKVALQYHNNRDLPVLIEGETGTGKELIARTIHYGNMKEVGSFVDINCATISANLFESELFGYEGGSFTSAASRGRKGKLDLAKDGTLFLDEIAEMPLELQAKLLRVIQEKDFFRVGGLEKIKTNLRLICATNISLAERVKQGAFRRDLYYRLKVGHITVPPLRERKSDIIPLTNMFLSEFAGTKGKKICEVSEMAQKMLLAYHWPGNVRELRNLIEWIVAMYDDDEIKPVHLCMLYPYIDDPVEEQKAKIPVLQPNKFSLPEEGFCLYDFVHSIILEALKKHHGNKAATARYLKCSRSSIYYLLHQTKDHKE